MVEASKVTQELKEIIDNLNNKNAIEILAEVFCIFEERITILDNSEKQMIMDLLNRVNKFLLENIKQEYKIYLVSKPNFIYADDIKNTKNLYEIFTEVVMNSLLLHTKSELATKQKVRENKNLTSFVCNGIFRAKDSEFSPKMIKCIGLLLEENEIKDFLNFVIKMDHKVQHITQEDEKENGEDKSIFTCNFLNHLNLLFTYLMCKRKELYTKIENIVLKEKRYFKSILIKNMCQLDIEKAVKITRDYNFDVFVSLFEKRPFLAAECCKKFNKGDFLIPRKSFLDLLVVHDTWFAPEIKNLCFLEESELLWLCDKSDLFLFEFFNNKAGSFYEYCKILATKGEERIIQMISDNVAHPNMIDLIKYISYTIKLSGNLKQFVIDTFLDKKEYFNFLLPFLSFETANLYLESNYQKEHTFKAFLRRHILGDFLIELHKYSSEDAVNNLLKDSIKSGKFGTNDYIFLIKYLETSECEYKYRTISLLAKNKSLKSVCSNFCLKYPGCIKDENFVESLLELSDPDAFLGISMIDLYELYNDNKKIKMMINTFLKNKNCNTYFKELNKLINKSKK
ncbi:hypothetical protein EHP00_991 [Ecytonucleospora hepatopenaei]|uniref:Uncharacterized protein n=1 Tax=Ecytonucleospora hepatopenaei TaxID=646526 RepID=A0A1W0E639_9MICR|nr:hypothetical protein EHP00_991 [Ecytonucleospora hepatopenaei]